MKNLLLLIIALFTVSVANAQVNSYYQKANDAYNAGNNVEARKWYQKAAELGHADAQYNLALYYIVDNNYTEAAKWLKKAAEQGHKEAQFNYAVCYNKGLGVSQSYTEAAKWLRKAAEQGYTEAQYQLGVYY